jgi:hypothetical protein
MTCVFCGHDLDDPAVRAAYDPWLGRLWRVCPECRRWNVAPMEARWEAMEEYERAARDSGRAVIRTRHLDLLDTAIGQLIRVGRAPRPELAGWRYGDLLPAFRRRGILAWLRRLVLGMPSSGFGYSAGYGDGFTEHAATGRWFASPFIDDAATLTTAFLHVPLADICPSCRGPLAVAPWQFQGLRITQDTAAPAVIATCALCDTDVAVPARDARAALRLGLSIVNRHLTSTPHVDDAARQLDRLAGPQGLLHEFARSELAIGELTTPQRLALGMALDEDSEAELLEAEWRHAEELASIIDGQLTRVEGFEEFRRKILD